MLGLAFKPNTDDMRDAPSLDIIPALIGAGARINAYDPETMEEAKHLLDSIDYAENAYDAVEGADTIVILTEWDQFRALDLERIKASLKGDVVVDLRNTYTPGNMQTLGFSYTRNGRAF